jgi:hypothetical protein
MFGTARASDIRNGQLQGDVRNGQLQCDVRDGQARAVMLC